jgi:acyl carrier protein
MTDSTDPLCALVAQVLSVSAEMVEDDSSTETIDTWDSIAGMSLVVLIEETYSVTFDASELAVLTSVGAIRSALRDKGVRI